MPYRSVEGTVTPRAKRTAPPTATGPTTSRLAATASSASRRSPPAAMASRRSRRRRRYSSSRRRSLACGRQKFGTSIRSGTRPRTATWGQRRSSRFRRACLGWGRDPSVRLDAEFRSTTRSSPATRAAGSGATKKKVTKKSGAFFFDDFFRCHMSHVTAGMRVDCVSPIRLLCGIYKSAPRWRKSANDGSKASCALPHPGREVWCLSVSTE